MSDRADYPRCATCRHWTPCVADGKQPANIPIAYNHDPDNWRVWPAWPGWCMAVEGPYDQYGGTTEPGPGRLAIANDASGYAASLLTTPDFGCVLHEVKE